MNNLKAKNKIAIHMSGNYAGILKYLPSFMEEYKFIGFSQTFTANEIINETSGFINNFYCTLFKIF